MNQAMGLGAGGAIAWSEPPVTLYVPDKTQTEKWKGELLSALDEAELSGLADALRSNTAILDFLAAVCSLSGHLRDLMMIRPARLADLLSATPDSARDALLETTGRIGGDGGSEAEIMAELRKAKARMALLCGLADLGGWWDEATVTAALSDFAEAALSAAVSFLIAGLERAGKLKLPHPDDPGRDSGLIVLGMGKFGARELNYSSDIDIIVFFDFDAMQLETDDPVSLFARLARNLIRIMQERTGDGYVFRADLRLRPDPGSTPLAFPVEAALNYYEAYGQNWERAAMIKARPVAGDRDAGHRFLRELAPFIWRKYLDYAAISDVHSIKRQIQAHRGHAEIAVAGHNIKLGRGGIREIEFFAQTQQLIAGGRLPSLRCLRTEDALAALETEGWIDADVRDDLTRAYWYLRKVEHRIQMVADEQSHTLPEDDAGLACIAAMMGDRDTGNFSQELTKTLKLVEKHYAGLFEASPELTAAIGNLVFTGDDDDPATLETLSALGFSDPSLVIKTVRGWHFGRFPAVYSAQARELLTELTPSLLEAIAATGEPDHTLNAFDRFLGGLPAGIQLFSLLRSNPGLTRLLLLILGSAPRLADIITRKPHVFDGMLEPAFAGTVPDRRTLSERLENALARAPDYESALDLARVFAAEQRFLIGVRLISGTLTPRQAGRGFSNLAEIIIRAMFERVQVEFKRRHGRVKDSSVCILAMGRLGSRELTAGSDLDLILLYDHDEDADFSHGDKPLAASQYFIRLAQRLIAAMSAPTAEGVLYELDFRLRPSGNAGPLATSVVSFLRYQEKEAWTWERQALVRARPIAGDAGLCARVDDHIFRLLAVPMDRAKLSKDIAQMRALIDKEKPAANKFDVKTAKGGLIDVEFIAQWATLRAGLHPSSTRATSIRTLIEQADPALLDAGDRELLVDALRDYNRLSQIVRLCIDDDYDPETSPQGLGEIIAHAFDLPDIRAVEAQLSERQKTVRALFKKLVG